MYCLKRTCAHRPCTLALKTHGLRFQLQCGRARVPSDTTTTAPGNVGGSVTVGVGDAVDGAAVTNVPEHCAVICASKK